MLRRALAGAAIASLAAAALVAQPAHAADTVTDPAAYVDPFIGTANAGNTFPGAVRPFGMLSWSPEGSNNRATRTPAPGGYQYAMQKIRGFSLAHLSGTGCAGASGDVPFFPHAGTVETSPSADPTDATYASTFAHTDEKATPGYYRVQLANGVDTELTATTRTGSGRFSYPANKPATMLIRTSDSEIGSTDATVDVDAATRTISGSVTSGNFCGYIGGASGGNGAVNRRAYYTLYFTATFDKPFAKTGSWVDSTVSDAASAKGGTTFGPDGYRPAGKGSGAYVTFDTSAGSQVNARVAISYVSLENAKKNLAAENPVGTTFDQVKAHAYDAWNASLGRVRVGGGSEDQRKIFYSALYHALLHPNVYSDVDGKYRGFGATVADQEIKRVRPGQAAQYANFSGWDVYRAQVQLLTWLEPKVGADIATSLLNQAKQNGGVWDRWTHNSGGTHVMVGDPAPIALAGIYAFGGTQFPVQEALGSLVKSARIPTALDSSRDGWNIAVVGQRPSLDQFLEHGYYPTGCNAWACANETLEMASADFAISQLAARLGDATLAKNFEKRSQSWQNQFNPAATAAGGYFQQRSASGVFAPGFSPASSNGFVEGTAAHYVWLVQHNPAGLFDAMGGRAKAVERLDRHFRDAQGNWHLVGAWDNNTYANMDNEPSIHVPYLYDYAGAPAKAAETVRQTVDTLWKTTPGGIPGNDDLGTMSSWYVFSAMGAFPANPSRADLAIGSPLFPSVTVTPNGGKPVTFTAPATSATAKYVTGVAVNGVASTKPWLPESLIHDGGTVDFAMAQTPDATWGTAAADAPPSFRTGEKPYQTAVTPGSVTVSAGGPAATITLRADRLGDGAAPVKFKIAAPAGLIANPSTGTMTVDPVSGTGTAQVLVSAPAGTPLSYLTLPVTFTSGGKALPGGEVLVVVAPAGSVVGHFSNVGVGDDGQDGANFDTYGWSYSRQALAAKGITPGTRIAVPGTQLGFTLADVPAGKPDNIVANGQKIDLTLPAGATAISLIGAGVGDATGGTATITYTDGSTAAVPVEFGDWCLDGDPAALPRFGNLAVAQLEYRNRGTAKDAAKPWLFATAPAALAVGKKVASLTLPVQANLRVFAVASNGTP